MGETSLHDIYQMLGGLTEAVKSLAYKIEENEKRNVTAIADANHSRSNVYRRLDELVSRTTHLENDTAKVMQKVEDMEKVTIEVTTMRSEAKGAGILGRWLLTVGGWVISAAVSIVAAYTWLTGRPPP